MNRRRKDKSQENRIHIANETQRNDLGNENKELESEWKGKPLGNRDKMCVTAVNLSFSFRTPSIS